jgi:hypothetical protein
MSKGLRCASPAENIIRMIQDSTIGHFSGAWPLMIDAAPHNPAGESSFRKTLINAGTYNAMARGKQLATLA